MPDDTKVAASEAASKNSESATKKTVAKKEPQDGAAKKQEKAIKYKSPFSFSDPLQSKFVNCLMKQGKKSIAQKILRDMFEELSRKREKDSLKTFMLAVENTKPSMEVKAKRIGGAVYQIPLEVSPRRQQSLSIRWLLEGARKKKGMPMYKRLALELLDASNKSGYAFTKKEEMQRMAQANKAFAHLARY